MDGQEQVWVGPVGGIILVRLRGILNPSLLKQCHDAMIKCVQDTGHRRVLYHLLEVIPSSLGLISVQQALNQEIQSLALRQAVLVPDAQTAFRASMAWGLNVQVFGNMPKAVEWLAQD